MKSRYQTAPASQEKPQQNQYFNDNAEHIVSQWPLKARKALGCIVTASRVFKEVFIGQEKISRISGYSVRHLQRWLNKFKDLNIIGWENRPNKTNVYTIDPILHTPSMRMRLQKWLFPLTLPLSLLASSWGVDISSRSNDSKNVVRDIFINNVYEQTVSRTLIDSRELRWRRLLKTKKRELSMKKEELVLLLEEVKHATGLPLTDYGAAKLLAFPLSVISQASTEFSNKSNVDDPYALFYGICKRLYSEMGGTPNQSKPMYVISTLALKVSDKNFIDDVKKLPKQERVSYSSQSQGPKRATPEATKAQDKKLHLRLVQSQARIKARNNGLTVGSQEYKAFIDSYISEHS